MLHTTRTFTQLVPFLAVFFTLGGCSHQQQRNEEEPDSFFTRTAGVLETPAFASQSRQSSTVSLADIAEKSLPSVVNIASTKVIRSDKSKMMPFFNDPFFRHFFGGPFNFHNMPKERREQSLGSGVIVSKDGLILTNNHVVANTDKIRVTLHDKEDYDAKIIGTDPKSDLALIKLKGSPKNLKPLALGDSGRMRLGDVVLAIGNPFGVGQTVTMGIVSAKGRANMGIVDYEDFIQTDAAINPGNSGGALVNMAGELIGINTAILSRTGGYQGIGFAIPSNMAKPIMESLLKHGKVTRGYLGVVIQELTPDLSKAMNLKQQSGVLISDVSKDGPAAKAGLKRGDVVLKVNSEKVDTVAHLRNIIASYSPGTKVTVEIVRDGNKKKIDVKLAEMEATALGKTHVGEKEGALAGLTVSNLSPLTRQKYKIPSEVKQGVVVEDVDADSAAAMAGIRPGDVIMEINRASVNNVNKFNQLYKSARGKVLLLVYRNGTTMYLLLSR